MAGTSRGAGAVDFSERRVSTARYASLNLGDHVGDFASGGGENRRRLKAGAGLAASLRG